MGDFCKMGAKQIKAIGLKRLFSFLLMLCLPMLSKAQEKARFKVASPIYQELNNPISTDTIAWKQLKGQLKVSFANNNVRYKKEQIPNIKISNQWTARAWKGEKVHTQLLVWANKAVSDIHFSIENLKGEHGEVISNKQISCAFVRYVLSDTPEDGCSHGSPKIYDSTLVADPIDIISSLPLEKNTVRPLWLTVNVPSSAKAGKYHGKLVVHADQQYNMDIEIQVSPNKLPSPSSWKFHLDMWQYPVPIAKMHGEQLWSEGHFLAMRPYYEQLAKAGQKVITANIIPQPWGPDHAYFEDTSLIKWIKKVDGTWQYDFSLFDRYIDFVMDCGIDQQINCYSMLSWSDQYTYTDEKNGKNETLTLKAGSSAYFEFWQRMLIAFTQHLKKKKWFEKTVIAMDERPLDELQKVIAMLKEVEPNWKIGVATDTNLSAIEPLIFDYSTASYLGLGKTVIERRRKEGKLTTFYTACMESMPTNYTFSAPAESAWLGWHAAAKAYDGYLFWAFNSWVANPLQDARWKRYPSGTLFQVYPGPRSSIRFEKLLEGIQDFEKLRILKSQFEQQKNNVALAQLNSLLKDFQIEKLTHTTAEEMITKARQLINRY